MRGSVTIAAMMFLFLTVSGVSQAPEPRYSHRAQELDAFAVSRSSRLNALAKLGAATGSTLLIVCGEMRFLTAPFSLSESHKSLDELIEAILRGPEGYHSVHRGRLIIVSPKRPRARTNRILDVPLGAVSFNEGSISLLSSLLGFYIRQSTGCNPIGYAYAGPPMVVNIPPFALQAATFQAVMEKVAMAPVPSMWVVVPDSGRSGCIPNPVGMWQAGLYAAIESDHSFSESTGPQFVR